MKVNLERKLKEVEKIIKKENYNKPDEACTDETTFKKYWKAYIMLIKSMKRVFKYTLARTLKRHFDFLKIKNSELDEGVLMDELGKH